MNYVTFAQLQQDVLKWERQLPEFDAVCGIPRSGVFPASLISLRRNIRLVEMSALLQDPSKAIKNAPLRESNPIRKFNKPCGNRLLIVDDSSSNNTTIDALRKELESVTDLQISYGAVYSSENSVLDYSYVRIPSPRLFEWNWFRHWMLQETLLDMDGVICEDWLGVEHLERSNYLYFLDHAKPLYLPQVPVRAIVTGRLEKYRIQTAEWLRRYEVKYSRLIMHPATDAKERQQGKLSAAAMKAEYYSNDSAATLFIESCIKQATQINISSRKPVLCMDDQRVYRRFS